MFLHTITVFVSGVSAESSVCFYRWVASLVYPVQGQYTSLQYNRPGIPQHQHHHLHTTWQGSITTPTAHVYKSHGWYSSADKHHASQLQYDQYGQPRSPPPVPLPMEALGGLLKAVAVVVYCSLAALAVPFLDLCMLGVELIAEIKVDYMGVAGWYQNFLLHVSGTAGLG